MKQEKPKKRPNRIGCLRWLGILLMIPVFCYAGMWLFARYGGEWATSNEIPIPPDSEFVALTYEESDLTYYMSKNHLYFHNSSPEIIYDWYRTNGVGFFDDNESIWKGVTFYGDSASGALHRLSVWNTTDWYDDIVASCKGVTIYRHYDAVIENFPEVIIPENKTAFIVSPCWANVR